jgi:hypothetical protein
MQEFISCHWKSGEHFIKANILIKEDWVQIKYEHRLTEDIDILRAGITLHSFSSSKKLENYTAWNGLTFINIPPNKVKVYQLTTKHIVTELPVD